MKHNYLLRWMLAIVFVSVVFMGCDRRERSGDVVSVSIAPVQYFVDRLSGGELEVNVMVPQGASHGTYSPTAAQMQQLSDSKIYFRIGYLGYEQAFISRLQELNPDMKEVNLSEGVELIRGESVVHGDHVHEGGVDPHIWMSPKVMLSLLPVIRESIVGAYPGLEETVQKNYTALLAEVEALHRDMQALVPGLSQKRFMIFHPALTYLARDYGLEQVPIEFEGKEPAPSRLKKLVVEAQGENIPVIFIQEEYDVRNAQLVAAETGASVVSINPLAYDWVANMKELMSLLNQHMQ